MKRKPTLIDSGYECHVYDLHNGKVYKKYAGRGHRYDMAEPLNKRQIRKVFKLAKKAEKYGVGPKVYYLRKYGYVTEKVNKCGRYSRKEFDGLMEKVRLVFQDLFDCDVYYGSPRNLGRKIEPGKKRGKLVLIDFGPESTYGE